MGRVPEGKQVLSIVDFTKPSREKRLWIIDLEEKRLLYHTLVAHGKGSGGAIATRFSNTTSSHQSSLGFYVTGEVYRGKQGRSLRLRSEEHTSELQTLMRKSSAVLCLIKTKKKQHKYK